MTMTYPGSSTQLRRLNYARYDGKNRFIARTYSGSGTPVAAASYTTDQHDNNVLRARKGYVAVIDKINIQGEATTGADNHLRIRVTPGSPDVDLPIYVPRTTVAGQFNENFDDLFLVVPEDYTVGAYADNANQVNATYYGHWVEVSQARTLGLLGHNFYAGDDASVQGSWVELVAAVANKSPVIDTLMLRGRRSAGSGGTGQTLLRFSASGGSPAHIIHQLSNATNTQLNNIYLTGMGLAGPAGYSIDIQWEAGLADSGSALVTGEYVEDPGFADLTGAVIAR